MLSLTRKTDYALVALAALARQRADRATTGGGPLSARRIAQSFDLPEPLTLNLLKSLQRAGLVRSTRGPGGGYVLGRPADQLTVADVVDAIEGPARLTPCCEDVPAPASASAPAPGLYRPAPDAEACEACRAAAACPIAGRVRQINRQLRDWLGSMTIAHLISEQGDPIPHPAAAAQPPRLRLQVANA